ncbi:hypothetical protein CBE01nite_29730 [Clostridium beijerinckii]|uniref:Uncharacterized protein n=1 Tax=Clostridium beijerinckii TaxID=1520 RepID=A0AB74VDD9_CLOBE|nr:hypothetical protein [Clostridium beijerinckii]NRZ28753.1 hypothetical protein [Clostridium beijerinckii]NYB95471.1 hypothetical protein [Clostridium beijerinckii]OOM24586.1 hypothetical protein CLBEI_20470 [Clostridium beijerinckii]QUN34431.1 hypothetical protein KEC93_21280 [Clostridium beijerinckii]SQB00615.1 Uncharacterised protein [Clostridium beijerinckii]
MVKEVDVRKKYSHELNEMYYILKNLENDRYYEKSGAMSDGFLATNIQKFRKQFDELINKIEYDKDSVDEEIFKAIDKAGI